MKYGNLKLLALGTIIYGITLECQNLRKVEILPMLGKVQNSLYTKQTGKSGQISIWPEWHEYISFKDNKSCNPC